MVDSKTLRRNAREQAVKLFNVLALASEFDAIPMRATPEGQRAAETEEGQQADGRPPPLIILKPASGRSLCGPPRAYFSIIISARGVEQK